MANDSTYYGIQDDVLKRRLAIDQGRMQVPAGAGLGVEIDRAQVLRYHVDC